MSEHAFRAAPTARAQLEHALVLAERVLPVRELVAVQLLRRGHAVAPTPRAPPSVPLLSPLRAPAHLQAQDVRPLRLHLGQQTRPPHTALERVRRTAQVRGLKRARAGGRRGSKRRGLRYQYG